MSTTIERIIPVATALIKNKDGNILLLKRSDVASYKGYWQFVEGKLDNDEAPDVALQREIKEEIGAEVETMNLTTPLYNEVPVGNKSILCFRIVFNVKIKESEIVLSDEHQAYSWFRKEEALKLELVPGVQEIVEKLV